MTRLRAFAATARQGALLSAVIACALPCSAQPVLKNAQITERPVTGTLQSTVRRLTADTAGPAWIAWETPAVKRNRGDHWCWGDGVAIQSNRLEPSHTLFIFLRIEERRIERIRMFDDGCAIDAGNRPVFLLRDVNPSESVDLFASLADGQTDHRVSKAALAALAQHEGPAAIQPLLKLARQAPDSKRRGEALFWLAQRAGHEATAAITDAIANDPETEVKKKAVFALSQLPADEGVPKLIEVARTNRNPAVRKQAMFWLGQSRDDRALKFFEEVLK